MKGAGFPAPRSNTVSAVVAWQRASRLDPLAADVHQRLLLLPPTARSGIADVPMVPVIALVVLCTICWVAGWVQLYRAFRARTGDASTSGTVLHPSRSLGAVLVVAALMGMTYTWMEARTLSTARLGVVRRPDMLRTAPIPTAQPAGGVGTGDMVRAQRQRGEWVEVLHADGRHGWLPASRITPLDAPLQDGDVSR
jgi:hypothetical protein